MTIANPAADPNRVMGANPGGRGGSSQADVDAKDAAAFDQVMGLPSGTTAPSSSPAPASGSGGGPKMGAPGANSSQGAGKAPDNDGGRPGSGSDGSQKDENKGSEGGEPAAPKDKPQDKPKDNRRSAVGETPEEREKYMAAIRSLRRDGWTEEDLKSLPPKRLLEIGAARGKNQRDVDQMYARSTGTPPPGRQGQDRPGQHAGARRPADDPAEPEATNADEGLDDALSELEAINPEAAERIRSEMTDRNGNARQDQAAVSRLFLDVSREGLTADFPGLEAADQYVKVLHQMGRLDPGDRILATNDRAQIKELMEDACLVVFGRTIKEEARIERNARRQAQRDGQPDDAASAERTRRTDQMNQDDIDAAAFETVSTVSDPAEQRRDFNARMGR